MSVIKKRLKALKKCDFCKGTGKSRYVEIFSTTDGKWYAKEYFDKFGVTCNCPDCNGSGFVGVSLN